MASIKYLSVHFPFQGCSLSAQGLYIASRVTPLQEPFEFASSKLQKFPPLQMFLRPAASTLPHQLTLGERQGRPWKTRQIGTVVFIIRGFKQKKKERKGNYCLMAELTDTVENSNNSRMNQLSDCKYSFSFMCVILGTVRRPEHHPPYENLLNVPQRPMFFVGILLRFIMQHRDTESAEAAKDVRRNIH